MKNLRIIYECIKLYFVYKELKKKGFMSTNYSLSDLLITGLKHKETFYNTLDSIDKEKEELNEKKQSEETTVC